MVVETLGPAAWAEIERETNTGPGELISANIYEDSVTLRLVAAAANCLRISIPEALEQFGRYWIRYAERGSYGVILDFIGTDLPTMLANFDRMHQAVAVAMPGAKVPSFSVVQCRPDFLRVRYRSERTGLEPFVTGLIYGLFDRFDLEGSVELGGNDGDGIEFIIHHEAKASGHAD